MTRTTGSRGKNRRAFFKDVATIGGAALAAAALRPAVVQAASARTSQPKPQYKGYHVTPHIRDYYAKARF